MPNPPTAASLPGVMTAAASLLAAAALVDTAGSTTTVSVTVSDTDISIQVGRHAGDPTIRAAAVAAYARALHTPVVHTPASGQGTWVETRAVLAGHPVHVWTLIHPREL